MGAMQPETQIAGFRTALGSLYALDNHGRTTRLKLSPGAGAGALQSRSPALYIHRSDMLRLMPLMLGAERLSLGSVDAAGTMFEPFVDRILALPGRMLAVVVTDRESGAFLRGFRASATPGVGLTPVEKAYLPERGESVTHVGNEIVELLGARALADAFSAAGWKAHGRAKPGADIPGPRRGERDQLRVSALVSRSGPEPEDCPSELATPRT